MRKIVIIFGFVFVGSSIGFGTAFPPIGKWTTYTKADDIYAFSPGGPGIWAGTAGGALYSDLNTSIRKFTNAEGLPGNDIRSVATGASGEVWFGLNGDGVSRYTPSGNIWRQYTTYDGLEDNRVISILEDGNILWFGMDGSFGKRGLVRFDDKGTPDNRQDDEWTPYDSLAGLSVQALGLKGDTLWIATPNGLFSAIRITSYPYLTQWQGHLRNQQNVTGIVFEPGAVWISTYGGGLFRWIGSTWNAMNTGLPTLFVNSLALVGNQFWAATDNGMAQYDFGNSLWIVHNEGLTNLSMRRVALDASSRAWAGGSLTGLWFWNGTQWQKIPLNQIAYDWIDHLFVSPTGKVLISHGNNGIGTSVFSQGLWDTLRIPIARDTSNWVAGILLDLDGSAWLGTWGAGLFHFGLNGTWTRYTKENTNNGLGGNTIAEMDEDSQGNIYLGDWYVGVDQLSPDRGTWTNYRYPGIPRWPFTALHVDRKGRIWSGFDDLGLLVYDQGTWSYYFVGSDPPLPASRVSDIAEDDSSNLWLATSGGLSYFNGLSFVTYTKYSTGGMLPSDQVYAVAMDSQGWVWAGTDAGLAVYDPLRKRWANFSKGARSLVNNKIRKLRIQPHPMDIHRDQIWIGTTNGLSLFEPDNSPPGDLGEINVFPNPYRSGISLVTFQGLPDRAEIWIYTASGELVKHLSQPNPHQHSLAWDGRNESGRTVSSGLFPYVIKGAGRARGGTLTILR